MTNEELVRVERANVVLRVPKEQVQHYINLGYNVTSEAGEVLTTAIPYDVATLQKHFVESNAKIEQLEKTIAQLTTELEELKRTSKTSTETETTTKKSTKKTTTK